MSKVYKAIIYKFYGISDDNKEYIYIGSTVSHLGTRKSQHKYHYKLYKDGKFSYCSSFIIYEKCPNNNFYKLEIIENEDKAVLKKQARELEQKYIDKIKEDMKKNNIICINCKNAKNSIEHKKEYQRQFAKKTYQKYREKYQKEKKAYYWANRDARLAYAKMKREKDYRKKLEESFIE